MVQMLTKLKPLGRPKQPRNTPKLHNTTIRDFGGGLNVVDSEQNLTSKFSPVFDNMVTYTDRRAGPRYGYEMWLKLKQGTVTGSSVLMSFTTLLESRLLVINWNLHPFTGTGGEHVTFSDWGAPGVEFNGITAEMINRTHGIRRVIDANHFEIYVTNSATGTGTSIPDSTTWRRDAHALGGEPIECKYFANYIILWTSAGEILRIDRHKVAQVIWSQHIAYELDPTLPGWTHTEAVASDIFGKELVCSNGRDKPLVIDFTREGGDWVRYLIDPDGTVLSNVNVPAFDACKSSFRFFTVHDTDLSSGSEWITSIRIAAKDTNAVYSDAASDPSDSVDIDMSKVAASPEQTVRGFAIIKDALLVITPTSTTLMKYGLMKTIGETGEVHDPQPLDTLNGFGTNAPRTIVEIGSDVFMVDFNGVPSAKLSSVSNAVVPERVSNYVETMMSKHIGRLSKETMRLKSFGFYDSKNKSVHFYIPKYDEADVRALTADPFFFDADMSQAEYTKRALITRCDDHQFEQGDRVVVEGAEGFSGIDAADINGERTVIGVLNENYVLLSIGVDLPLIVPATPSGGGIAVTLKPINEGSIGYLYHYVPQLKLTTWSRFKTPANMMFNCGCGTVEGRAFVFTRDGFMMRYGSPDHRVYADWYNMYDFATWTSGQDYLPGQRVFDETDGRVYLCLEHTEAVAVDFPTAREDSPDTWEEYKGEPINFEWELPWADFGARQQTKALRFLHIDANGDAQFTCSLFSDNIYKDAATGQFMPARQLSFVPNEAAAYGAGAQVYGAGRRTREQKLWTMPTRFKLLKVRMDGSTTGPLSFSAVSMMYHLGSMVRG